MQLSMTLAGVISQRLLPKIRRRPGRGARDHDQHPGVANLIREGKIAQIKTVIETSSKEGMVSMDQDIQRLFKEKLIDKEVAQTHMDNPEMLDRFKLI